MKSIHANLLGKWENLSADNECKVGTSFSSPNIWWEEEGHDLFKYDYINIHYKGADYRIHPSFIQVVTTN
ncbi:hypothetical protein [Enterococcus gallinarum]|uniref:hypothetical protein n=1 Tax=Enterococcus gallinarum TaxID=1353 RepID=UPI003D6BF585